MNRRELGSRYEKLAARELAERGYEILALNYRCRQGEVDIVCRQGGVLVFVEVKYRSTEASALPPRLWTAASRPVSGMRPSTICTPMALRRIPPAALMWWEFLEIRWR